MIETRWTAKLVAERFEEAAETLHRLPEQKARGYFSTWPSVVCDVAESYGWHETRVRLGPPHPAAIDRMHEVFSWLRWIDPDDARIVWLRAEDVRWKLISARFGISRTTAWRMWVTALVSIAARLDAVRHKAPTAVDRTRIASP
jgi:hypothetical protein